MRYLQRGVAGILFAVALGGSIAVQKTGVSIAVTSSAFAQQQQNDTISGRVKRWTRARLEAAKKHWAEDQQRFSACVKELDDLKAKSKKRISLHRQGHFLESCMQRTQ